MSVTLYPQRPPVQLEMTSGAEHRRDLARATNLLMAGHNNATLQVTLGSGAGVNSYTLIDPRISLQTAVVLVPMTADAAKDLRNIYVTVSKGQAVINHPADLLSDRTFQIALIG